MSQEGKVFSNQKEQISEDELDDDVKNSPRLARKGSLEKLKEKSEGHGVQEKKFNTSPQEKGSIQVYKEDMDKNSPRNHKVINKNLGNSLGEALTLEETGPKKKRVKIVLEPEIE
eukprot:CAMPEP_0202962650 /NCGR_PEP_ID=MMETSP1396-20130829/6754_1 /ASSEMBLY_ACC=CAM_ASM_000872 /TAXON_ID= /ORGANISM="Pseudokeronopsis sp., Strain Brazil" /LENGTH=114 /DNA_ID=CAMNT_0049683379 /DNA_START=843 /DNA_END=1187 /DNA_ORIENTATION=-